jgi:AcrR family transcriptional regulator
VEADPIVNEASLRALDGRVPGRRGLATRQRLLEATAEQLETTSYRDVKVVDIARAANTSPATFYQYFPHVEAAVLELAEGLAETGARELRGLVAGGVWEGEGLGPTALGIADGYLSFWERHRALISVIDLAALEGDRRFRDLRTRLLNEATNALQGQVEAAIVMGRVPDDTDPKAVAFVLTSMLAHVAAHRPGLEDWGVPLDRLRHTVARIISWSVTGDATP